MRADIERDLEVMHVLARLARDYYAEGRRLRPTEVVREYEKTILDELDLMREAANASQLRRNFQGSDLLYVPEVHWDLCRGDVMVMERIRGVLISELDELKSRGTNIQRLAENGVQIFFTQVFRHNFFHADMHPGNIFVRSRTRSTRSTQPSTSGSWERSTRVTSTISPRIFSPSSTATTTA